MFVRWIFNANFCQIKLFFENNYILQTYLIEKQEDLLKIKPYKVTIVFVDFNERNIILENPDTEVGDCRRLTTEIFLLSKCKSSV